MLNCALLSLLLLGPWVEYIGSLSLEDRRAYRALRGIQGQTFRSKRMQVEIRSRVPSFDPGDLDEFIESQKVENMARAKELIDECELTIKQAVISTLKAEYPEGDDWWVLGVPMSTRKDASSRRESDNRAHGAPENYLYLIDYRAIVESKWELFERAFAISGTGRKRSDKTDWIRKINEWRNIVSHPTSGRFIKPDELVEIESFVTKFKANLLVP